MKVRDLKLAKFNPRKISEKRLSMLGKAMREFGDLSGIVFNVRTGHLIGGHQRIKHRKPEGEIVKEEFRGDLGTVARGHVKTPFGDWVYREVDWDPKKEKAAMIAANRPRRRGRLRGPIPPARRGFLRNPPSPNGKKESLPISEEAYNA